MVGGRVYAYLNASNIMNNINVMDNNGLYLKQIGVGHLHTSKGEAKKTEKYIQRIQENKSKAGKMGKSIKNPIEYNFHVHTNKDKLKHNESRVKLSSKERRIAYESIELAKRNGGKINGR